MNQETDDVDDDVTAAAAADGGGGGGSSLDRDRPRSARTSEPYINTAESSSSSEITTDYILDCAA